MKLFPERIDENLLLLSIKNSHLDEFVKNQTNGLDTVINQNSTNISGGEKQRLAIARALYRGSKLLILDEPTSALDVENQGRFLKVINGLKNITTIIATHNKNILSVCDKVYELKGKKLTEIIN